MRALLRYGPYALVLGIGVFFQITGRIHAGDTRSLVHGVGAIRRSLAEWKRPDDPMDVFHFPLYQYIPGLAFAYLGATEETSLDLFCVLSLLAFAGSVALMVNTLRARSRAVAAAAALILVAGPLLSYSRASFGEMLAAFLILAHTAGCLRSAGPVATAALFVPAGLTKETALPFLLLIAAVGFLMDRRAGRPWSGARVTAVGCAALVTAGLTVGFNYYRFGTPYNAELLRPLFIVPSLKTQASFFAAIWLSPNGGVSFFWPSFVVAVAGCAAAVLRTQRPARPSLIPLAGAGALLLLLTAGFSKWYAPFGWPAWGPRLMLPWIPACVLLVFWYYAKEFGEALDRLCVRPGRWLLVLSVLAAASLPQAVVLARPAVQDRINYLRPGRQVGDGRAYYYRGLHHILWPRPHEVVLLACYRAIPREVPVLLTSLAFTLAVVGFGWQIRVLGQLRQRSTTLPQPATGHGTAAARRAG
jgi:hypothetical protein